MQAKDVYDKIGGSYDTALSQFRKEERFLNYFGMFLRDDSFPQLKEGMESGDMQKAFVGAHTLKGVAGNLAFTKLCSLATAITEDLRNGRDIEHAKIAYPEVEACYNDTISAVKEFIDAAP